MGGFGLDGIHLQQIYPINGKVGTGWYSSPAGYITGGKSVKVKTIRLIDLLLSANQGAPRGG